MVLFQGALLLVLGYGVLGVVYRSLSTGWLPFGRKGFSRLEFRIDEQPFAYWTAFTFYCGFGVWCLFLAYGVLTGHMEPLPLR